MPSAQAQEGVHGTQRAVYMGLGLKGKRPAARRPQAYGCRYGCTQVLTGHGCFGRFLYQIRDSDSPGCHHCVERPENTVEVCPAWAEHRRVLVEAIAGGSF